jgi:hypothetical protein
MLERACHVDDIVGPLRMAYQNQGPGAAGTALAQDFGDFVLPARCAATSALMPCALMVGILVARAFFVPSDRSAG